MQNIYSLIALHARRLDGLPPPVDECAGQLSPRLREAVCAVAPVLWDQVVLHHLLANRRCLSCLDVANRYDDADEALVDLGHERALALWQRCEDVAESVAKFNSISSCPIVTNPRKEQLRSVDPLLAIPACRQTGNIKSHLGPIATEPIIEEKISAHAVLLFDELEKLGQASSRYKLWGTGGSFHGSREALLAEINGFEEGSLLLHYQRWRRLINYLAEAGSRPQDARGPMIAKFLQTYKAKGPTAAHGVRASLIWLSTHLGIDLHARDPTICALSRVPVNYEERSAPSFTIKMVIHCEYWANSGQEIFAYVAWVILALVHGCIRFCDAQRSTLLKCGSSLHGRASDSKAKIFGRRRPMHWYAPLTGLTGVPWAQRLHSFIQRLSTDKLSFLFAHIEIPCGLGLEAAKFVEPRLGSKQLFLKCMRGLLRQAPLQLHAAVPKKFSGHSPRHFHRTVAGLRQLPMCQRTAIGHWSPGSTMPVRYDFAKGWSELAAKDDNLEAILQACGGASGAYSFDDDEAGWMRLSRPSSKGTPAPNPKGARKRRAVSNA